MQGLMHQNRVYSGQLQGTTASDEMIEQTVKVSCISTFTFSALFWIWAFYNTTTLVYHTFKIIIKIILQ